MNQRYHISTNAVPQRDNIIYHDNYRFTLLTEKLVRIEYNEKKKFIDSPTQIVWNRDFNRVSYEKYETGNEITIETSNIYIKYSKSNYSCNDLKIIKKSNEFEEETVWMYGMKLNNLKGTTRTLDNINGAVELEQGILSKDGIAVLDDSKTYLILDNGELQQREQVGFDIYIFAYGRDYKKCLKDYFYLTGNPPMLPKYALGNWWSRFYRYTEESYMKLMNRFIVEQIPISIAMIDMDWHMTEIDPKYGSGWTGYTWNRKLFPNPKRLLTWLHEKDMKVSLNVHPADGVRGFEDAYLSMATELQEEQNLNIDQEDPIRFDCASPTFMEAYFKYLHEPEEENGVDFWWIDWQQGEESKLPGLDPLFILNHYHYLHNQKENNRGLILSRYSGPGSQRYPVGFSGDSIISWESLEFQPYFTANASNIGYGWWSNDIGGHMLGYHDEELQARWLQFGVFSPMNRLHCSADPFNHKEPWNYSHEIKEVITRYMQFRQKLLPYLYTMNYTFSTDGTPLLRPMYYEHPYKEEAYQVPNQYYFGSELISIPITSKKNDKTHLAKVEAWLPEGNYVDIFTGEIYEGDRTHTFYRSINTFPVLLKSGGILPLEQDIRLEDKQSNPKNINLVIADGRKGEFSLYEDDGETKNYKNGDYVITKYEYSGRGIIDLPLKNQKTKVDASIFYIHGSIGNHTLVPEVRNYILSILGCGKIKEIIIESNNTQEVLEYTQKDTNIEIHLSVASTIGATIYMIYDNCDYGDHMKNIMVNKVYTLLDRMEIEYKRKEHIYNIIKLYDGKDCSTQLNNLVEEKEIIEPILEQVTSGGRLLC